MTWPNTHPSSLYIIEESSSSIYFTERFRQRLGPPWGSPCLQGIPYYSADRCVAPNSTSSDLRSLPMKSLELCTASSYAYSTATPSYAHQRAIDLGTLSTPPPHAGRVTLPSTLTHYAWPRRGGCPSTAPPWARLGKTEGECQTSDKSKYYTTYLPRTVDASSSHSPRMVDSADGTPGPSVLSPGPAVLELLASHQPPSRFAAAGGVANCIRPPRSPSPSLSLPFFLSLCTSVTTT